MLLQALECVASNISVKCVIARVEKSPRIGSTEGKLGREGMIAEVRKQLLRLASRWNV